MSRACSSALLFDYTPPRAGRILVTSSSGTEKTYFNFDEDPRIIWFDFEDIESGIEKYEISVIQSNTSMLNHTFSSSHAQFQMSLVVCPQVQNIP